MDFLALVLNLSMLLCAGLLFRQLPLARWYLVAVLPGILSLSGLRALELFGLNYWYSLPIIYLLGMIWHALVLMVGFAMTLRSQFIVLTQEGEVEKPAVLSISNSTPLSKREMDILLAFTNGFSYTEISDAMFISPHTVRTHLKNIYAKIGVNSKAEAVRWVLEK